MNQQQEKKYMHQRQGPGGKNCPCCGPSPKDRKRFRRRIKHALRAILKRSLREHETP